MISRVKLLSLIAPALLLVQSVAFAEVTTVGQGGFAVAHSMETQASTAEVYRAIVDNISKWWDGDHSWSGDAANLYFDARLGGCFCERLPDGGGVEHLRIIYLAPEQEIRLLGALGPLQQMGVHGAMTWQMSASDTGTTVTFQYTVSGLPPTGGFEGLAPVVDGVIGSQLQGLISFLKPGKD